MLTDPRATLADLVSVHPSAARVLHRHRLDFCCGGQSTLAEACAARGLDPDALRAEIEQLAGDEGGAQLADATPEGLIGFIMTRYHAPLREELPRLRTLVERVERVHADKVEYPAGLAQQLAAMQRALEEHLAKEEQVLFPMIRSGRGYLARMPVQVMMHEHLEHAENVQRVRAMTRDFRLPPYACATWSALYEGLQALERDLMEHIHLENNVLFPQVMGG